MKLISIKILLVLCLALGVNLSALTAEEPGPYVLACNMITGATLLVMIVLVIVRKKKLQQLQQRYIDRFFSRN